MCRPWLATRGPRDCNGSTKTLGLPQISKYVTTLRNNLGTLRGFYKLRTTKDARPSTRVGNCWSDLGPHRTQLRCSILCGRRKVTYDQLVFRNRGVSASDSELKWSQMVLSKLPGLAKQRMLFQPNLQEKETGGM